MKKLIGTEIGSYLFDASAKTVEIQGLPFNLSQVLLITNVTDQIVIYNPLSTSLGATLQGSILTLDYDTSSMDDTDVLQILINIPERETQKIEEFNSHGLSEIMNKILVELRIMNFILSTGFRGRAGEIEKLCPDELIADFNKMQTIKE